MVEVVMAIRVEREEEIGGEGVLSHRPRSQKRRRHPGWKWWPSWSVGGGKTER